MFLRVGNRRFPLWWRMPRVLAVGPGVALVLVVATWWLVGRGGPAPLGTVQQLQGQVSLERMVSGKREVWTPSPGDEVLAGDVVRTGANSHLWLTLVDGSRVEVGPGSLVQLQVLLASPSPMRRLRLQVGRVVAQVAKAADRATHFEVETPTAVAGVRGTTFAVYVGATGHTTVFVQEGVVHVANPRGEVTLSAGEVAETPPQQAPAPAPQALPVRYRPGRDRDEDFRLAGEALRALVRQHEQGRPAQGKGSPGKGKAATERGQAKEQGEQGQGEEPRKNGGHPGHGAEEKAARQAEKAPGKGKGEPGASSKEQKAGKDHGRDEAKARGQDARAEGQGGSERPGEGRVTDPAGGKGKETNAGKEKVKRAPRDGSQSPQPDGQEPAAAPGPDVAPEGEG